MGGFLSIRVMPGMARHRVEAGVYVDNDDVVGRLEWKQVENSSTSFALRLEARSETNTYQ